MGIEAVRDAVERLGAEDGSGYAGLFGQFAEDMTWTVVGSTKYSGTFHGVQELLEKMLMPLALELSEMGKMVVDNVISDAQHVVLQAHVEGRVAKSGESYDNTYCIVFHAPDGKVTQVTEYCDTELVTQAFGRS
jgi:uncharacterized protein